MSSMKTGRRVVAAASDPARRPGLGGRLAGSDGPGRQMREDVETEKPASRRWPWKSREDRHQQGEVEGAGGAANAATADWATRGFGALFLACLAAGPVALVVGVTGDEPVIVPKSQAPVQDPASTVADSTVAGERGALTVQQWLSSTSESPQLAADASSWPKAPTKISDVHVAAAQQGESDGTWQVTVAAQTPAGERYFAVPVQVESGAAVALALPRPTPAPAVSKAPGRDYNQTAIAPTSAMATTLEDFLGAYLGGDDTTRFTSPGARMPSVEGSQWTKVRLDRVDANVPSGADATLPSPAEGEKAQVYVEYAMQRGDDRTTAIPSSMSLSLTARGGRWEVSSIDPAPRMKGTQPSSESSSSPDEASTTPTSEGN